MRIYSFCLKYCLEIENSTGKKHKHSCAHCRWGNRELKYLPKVSQLASGKARTAPQKSGSGAGVLNLYSQWSFVVLWDKPSLRSKRFDFRESATQDQAKRGTVSSRKKKEVK